MQGPSVLGEPRYMVTSEYQEWILISNICQEGLSA